MRRLFVALVGCLLSPDARAGWYHVETYTGAIGGVPIHLSVQYYDAFGSGIGVEGSYFYDSKLSPIALYGARKDGQLRLCEISGKAQLRKVLVEGSKTPVAVDDCPFALEPSGDGLRGRWISAAQRYDVILTRVGTLDDTGDAAKVDGTVEIPFWGQTTRHAFIGTYAKKDAALCLTRVAVIDKQARAESGALTLDNDDCTAGLLTTPIYLNIDDGPRPDTITVNYARGRIGTSVDYRLDPRTGTYRP